MRAQMVVSWLDRKVLYTVYLLFKQRPSFPCKNALVKNVIIDSLCLMIYESLAMSQSHFIDQQSFVNNVNTKKQNKT